MKLQLRTWFARGLIFAGIVCLMTAFCFHPAVATTITVKIDNGILSFTGAPPSTGYNVYNHAPNTYAGGKINSATTDSSGGSAGNLNVTGMNGTFEIEFPGDNFVGIVNSGSYTSRQEMVNSGHSIFDGYFGFGLELYIYYYSPAAGPLFLLSQLDLINPNPYPVKFTNLLVYKDLDPTYFTPSAFNSPAAIATGTFVEDLATVNGGIGIPAAGGADIPAISIPIADISLQGYQLVTGSVEPYLGDGMFGPPIPFSVGSAVPEPASWALMAMGFAGIGAAMLHNRRRTSAAGKWRGSPP